MTRSEFREDLYTHKTRMDVLSCVEESMTIRLAVLIQCQRVTDRRTDVQPISWKPDVVIDSWYVVDVAIIVRWLWYSFGTLGATFYTGAHSSRALRRIFHREGDFVITWATFSWRGRFYTDLNIAPGADFSGGGEKIMWHRRELCTLSSAQPLGCNRVRWLHLLL